MDTWLILTSFSFFENNVQIHDESKRSTLHFILNLWYKIFKHKGASLKCIIMFFKPDSIDWCPKHNGVTSLLIHDFNMMKETETSIWFVYILKCIDLFINSFQLISSGYKFPQINIAHCKVAWHDDQ